MKRIFNTSNLLLLGIAVASAGLLYLGMLWHCPQRENQVAQNNNFESTYSIPS